ncbi:hypothetical protein M378DRAFT_169060 [Amanita muscaria Koide BX008]|uniref:Uncharacterized protein n=1 Tax=Amanita muscaria (strain Koide BX008) TaxID=946122 RepID=A0A0C2WE63_AMAMK|nr:hypothetical protein M378DRAFT_169060 [Amanita muscaria Koide BX008]
MTGHVGLTVALDKVREADGNARADIFVTLSRNHPFLFRDAPTTSVLFRAAPEGSVLYTVPRCNAMFSTSLQRISISTQAVLIREFKSELSD